MSADTQNERPTNAAETPTPQEALKDLAKRILGQHAKVQNSLRASLRFAREAGESLKKAKEIVKDEGGAWGRWHKAQCKLSNRQAQKYMQLAEGFGELIRLGHDPDKLTINQALTLLAPLRDKKRAPGSDPVPAPQGEEHPPVNDADNDDAAAPAAAPAEAERPKIPDRLSQGELRAKTREAQRLVACQQIRFTEDTPEGKFVRDKVKTLVEQIRRQAEKARAAEGQGEPVQAIHLAIALIERLSQELHAGVVVEIREPEEEIPATAPEVHPTADPVPPPSDKERPASPAVPLHASLLSDPSLLAAVAAYKEANQPTTGRHERNGTPALVS